MQAQKKTFPKTQISLLSVQLVGDAIFSFAGLSLAYAIRFETPLRRLGVTAHDTSTYRDYLPLLMMGTVFFLASYAYLHLYDGRLLLRPQRALSLILRSVTFWLIAFVCTSLVFKLEPSVSRLFALIATVATLVSMAVWRWFFFVWLKGSRFRERLRQNVVIVGWNKDAEQLIEAIVTHTNHPYNVLGVLLPNQATYSPFADSRVPKILGSLDTLPTLLAKPLVDMIVVADLNLPKEKLLEIAGLCEETYTDFKIVPSFFQIFVSNLRLQSISGVPILGLEELPIRRLQNIISKRMMDTLGALVGLVTSLPIIAVLAILIKKESRGPIFYRQTRTGLHGRTFVMYKLRSMRTDAEIESGARWAVADDPRRTHIGTFMRATNLDELPQFWNVLMGDMSLVGPRPERPELIERFAKEIPHYNPRHEVRPGITGWAQINGLRGNTSLVDRIKHDLYYIENWSPWFDVQIMIMTFFRRDNAY
jgi:exopolysaccharide biosynthesis polyprenyl glycosylphosphotransferase